MRVRTREERGQAFALMVVALVALLGTSALVMDVGFAWYAKRQVQASADAAALAGAQQLPDITSATSTATQYATLNTPDNLSNVAVNVTTRCSVSAATWCSPTSTFQANTIAVTETAKSPVWFGRVLGFDHFDVKGVATACQPCSSAPVDIMLVLDRTGSMCQPTGPGGSCTDLNNAKAGVRTMLGIMDPNIDTVGMVAFPPYDNGRNEGVCGTSSVPNLSINGDTNVTAGSYDLSTLTYLDDSLGSTFKTSSTSPLNESSSLVAHVQLDTGSPQTCPIQSFGSTSYDDALKAGQAELVKDGRPGVPKVIVFMTDGEANEGAYYGASVANHGLEPDLADPTTNFNMSPASSASTVNPGDAQPCHSAENAATAIKAAGTTIYTIGYDLYDATTGYAYCVHGVWGQIDESYASSGSDYTNFRCSKIGVALAGPNRKQSYADGGSGHWQPTYPPASPDRNNWNPCTNTITGDHREMPLITSYDTLTNIASPGNFYNKPTAGDVTQIFAAIAADITKGTSRLVDDSY